MFVLDASVTLAWYFADEASAASDKALDLLTTETAIAPAIWAYEVGNVLTLAQRRGRMSEALVRGSLASLRSLPIEVEAVDRDLAFGDVLSLAREHGLTAYDASYLEIAQRRGLPLATVDARLRAAATASGTSLLSP